MKHFFFLCLLAVSTAFAADEAKTALAQPGKLVAAPDLKEPFGSGWVVKYGTWDMKGGEVAITELPEQKHAAVLWHETGLQSAVIECEFQFEGGRAFLVGCDSPNKHVGRLVITPKAAKIAEDSSEIKGKQPGQTIAETALDLKPGQWYAARFEWKGDQMAATVDGHRIQGQHPTLSKEKTRWWLAVSGAKVRVRNLKAWEGK